MENNYLDKVVDQLVSETKIDYDEERFLPPPFTIPSPFYHLFCSPFSPYPTFIIHCKNIYGLNKQEIRYVWSEYMDIIKDKIENNGL